MLQNNDEETIANIDSELEQFNKAPLSHDDSVQLTTSGKQKYSLAHSTIRSLLELYFSNVNFANVLCTFSWLYNTSNVGVYKLCF